MGYKTPYRGYERMIGPAGKTLALPFAMLLLGSACGGGSSGDNGGSGGTGGTLITGGSAGMIGSGGSSGQGAAGGSAGSGARNACPEGPGTPGAVRQQQVSSVQAQLLDLAGNPAIESPQVCGVDVCVFIEDTDSSGNLSIAPARFFDRPAFKNGIGLRYAKFAFLLPNQPDHDLGAVRTVSLPAFADGAELVAGRDVSSGPVTLTLAADAKLEIDILTYTKAEERTFRAAGVPIDQAPRAVDPSLGFALLFALSPVDTVICPAARMSVSNTPGWAPATAVEFFVHGVSIEEHWAPYGGWAKLSEGAVSSDGASITTAQGGGIPVLGVIGIRQKP
jgi:hypothetical protein